MSEIEAKKAIEAFFAGFNSQDDEALRQAMNFPHVRIGVNRVRIIPEPSDFKAGFNFLIEREGWHHSMLDAAKAIHASDDKVHFAIEFSRFHTDGTRYVTHKSLWIVTKQNNHWGVLCRSSYAP
ncbi:MAG: hypothetical protein JRI95_13520 [Deltaproteobacteria bacterium]|nr:hypothetical protein [Deltaproteobacteria bacterium]MBW2087302.1 hypothetical protein [Deltaproteobacteria bacterium]